MTLREFLTSDWLTYGLLVFAVTLIFIFVGWFAWKHRETEPQMITTNKQRVCLSDVYSALVDSKWLWSKNPRCKQLTMVVDCRTRPRTCELFDRYGDPITLAELRQQLPPQRLDLL